MIFHDSFIMGTCLGNNSIHIQEHLIDNLNLQVLTGSDKLILISSNISKQRVSVIVQNISTSPFLLNPKSSLGFLIVKPQSLRIPRTLPRVPDMQVVKRSSTQGLYSKTKKIGNEILFAPLIDINSNIFDFTKS